MKKFFILFCLSVVCFSCGNLTRKDSNEAGKITEDSNFPSDKLEFAELNDTTTYHIANKTDMPAVNIIFNISYPLATEISGNDKLLIKDFIGNCLGKEYDRYGSVSEAVKAKSKKDVANYKLEICGSTPEKKIKAESWMNHEYITSDSITYNAHGLLSYICETYSYTGGAHGLNVKSCYLYDFYDNVIISLNNIFKDDSFPAILTLIKENLKSLPFANDIAFENVNVTENFYIDNSGITWIYNPYEIAPYAVGAVEVKLPYSELECYFNNNTPIKSIL